MKNKIVLISAFIAILIALNLIFVKRISRWLLSSKTESTHFIIAARPSDAELSNRLQSVLEKDYMRISNHLGIGLNSKSTVHLYTNNQLYNMAFGNPFPIPRRMDNYGGQHIENDFYILIPASWVAQPDSVFPPERARTTVAHEMTHVFVYQINPNVKGWITEGIAKFEENVVFTDSIRKIGYTSWIGNAINENKIPRFNELVEGEKITSSKMVQDYLFASTFFDFASAKYGYQIIREFIKSNDFDSSFGKPENEIWKEWAQYLKERY
jgi:hypothetical protein